MTVIERFLNLIAPFACLDCGEEGSLWCVNCEAGNRSIPSRCYRCLKLTEEFRTCPSCRASSDLAQVWVAAAYEGTPKSLVRHLKFERARAAANDVARALERQLGAHAASGGYIISAVPTAASRARHRGYDQAELIARALARRTGLPWKTLLARSGSARQLGASRQQRRTQLQEAFRPQHAHLFAGKNVLLVDDVLTTGATLEAAAQTLKKAGARRVSAIVFVQA